MIIVVNTRLLIHDRLDGIGRFTYETLKRITQKQEDTNFVFLFDRKIHEEFVFSENVTPVKLLPPARRTWLFNWWLNISVHGVLRDLDAELFLSPDGFLPLRGKTKCLPVIHDLNFEHYPEDLPSHYSKWYRKKFPLFAKKATRIATVSEFSKQDIVKQYSIDPDNIDVVYNAASPGFIPLNAEQINATRKQYTEGKPYFLFVGSLHPRKNLARLIEAFGIFKRTTSNDIKLVILGGKYWMNDALEAAIKTLPEKSDVIFTKRVPETELHRIMASALALTYVPYFEGFGIPLVEAMACDVPVISGNKSAMPEVAGNAACYCDPFSVESICDAMKKVAGDSGYRDQLIVNGRDRRQHFSWEKSADALWNSIEKTLACP